MILWKLNGINAASSVIMRIEVEMARVLRTKNKKADSDCGLRHHYSKIYIGFCFCAICQKFWLSL